MTQFTIPTPQLDLTQLPPPITTTDPASFAHYTLKERVPKILTDTIAANTFPADIQARLQAMQAELSSDRIAPLQEATPDRDFWQTVSAPYLGCSWLDTPFYWVETFFYRRILEATGYFQPGAGYQLDPFAPIKAAEWFPNAAPALVNQLLIQAPIEPAARFRHLMYASLWGNRVDLSYNVAGHLNQTGAGLGDTANLLVDDIAPVWNQLQAKPATHIAFIADNAGTELAMDLALIEFLLTENIASQLDLYLKPQPFFVSDAMPSDLDIGLAAIMLGGAAAQGVTQRLAEHRRTGRLRVRTHWYFPTSLFYFQLPPDLHQALSETALTIVKGDANYRRLLGEAQWPATTPFAEITAYFPTSLVALRTLKSEIIVGLTPEQVAQLTIDDADWQVNGKRGVIQSSKLQF